MGRIGEALRRAGTVRPGSQTLSPPTDQERVFASPWKFDDLERVIAPAESPAERRKPTEVPLGEPVIRRRPQQAITERFRSEWKARLSVGAGADPALAEQFRRLAATLLHSQRADRLKIILVTSAVPDEGKTLASVNLSLILSESYGRRVLLVDADLRRPSIGSVANLEVNDGLSEAVTASEDREIPVVQLSDTLTLLPAGRPLADPLSGLSSPRMTRLLEQAATQYDWVIIDTPPLAAAADAGLLCEIADAALLVVRVNSTPQAAIQRAIDTLGRDRILGVILNGVEASETTAYHTYGYAADEPIPNE
jgi:protein-tyrosine kinase